MRCGDSSDISGGGVDAKRRILGNIVLCEAGQGRYLSKMRVEDGDFGLTLLGKDE
jgi:hypothetical protein